MSREEANILRQDNSQDCPYKHVKYITFMKNDRMLNLYFIGTLRSAIYNLNT